MIANVSSAYLIGGCVQQRLKWMYKGSVTPIHTLGPIKVIRIVAINVYDNQWEDRMATGCAVMPSGLLRLYVISLNSDEGWSLVYIFPMVQAYLT